MPAVQSAAQKFTYRGNRRDTRHGWLRLTPAYSMHLVDELLSRERPQGYPVLEPFCGTGTTVLQCVERGIACHGVELNPFLVWLASAKTARYSAKARTQARELVERMAEAAQHAPWKRPWTPPISRIDRWWSPPVQRALGRAFEMLAEAPEPAASRNLARLAFCRTLIESARVSFGHQSMSFRKDAERGRAGAVANSLRQAIESIEAAAQTTLPRVPRRVVQGDARALGQVLGDARYGAVITSPPYSNRMSYIRELRPYMYWLGYLETKSSAGELDWQAIGGTWGSATSRLVSWSPSANENPNFPRPSLQKLARRIENQSFVLAQYVRKYFYDMALHADSLFPLLAPGAALYYVVGNSKFYDVLLPVERLLAAIFKDVGFVDVRIERLRKRTSKAELYEYLVSGRKPA